MYGCSRGWPGSLSVLHMQPLHLWEKTSILPIFELPATTLPALSDRFARFSPAACQWSYAAVCHGRGTRSGLWLVHFFKTKKQARRLQSIPESRTVCRSQIDGTARDDSPADLFGLALKHCYMSRNAQTPKYSNVFHLPGSMVMLHVLVQGFLRCVPTQCFINT